MSSNEQELPPIPRAPSVPRVDTEAQYNDDGTVTVGGRTRTLETVGAALQGTDPGKSGEFSTDGKNKRVGEGDDGFNQMAGWLGTGGRQTQLLEEHGSAALASRNLSWYDKNVLKITPETLQSAEYSIARDILGAEFNGRLKAAGAAEVGWGENREMVVKRLEEVQTRPERRKQTAASNVQMVDEMKEGAEKKNQTADDRDYQLGWQQYAETMRRQTQQEARKDRLSRERESRLDRLQQRADQKFQAAQNLQIEQMRIESNERRFNKELEISREKDRAAAIKGIASGFASLGAAFTL